MKYGRLSPLKPGQEQAFARLLRAKLDAAGLTIGDMAEACGVRKTSAARWLSGYARPGGQRFKAMADRLGCEPEALIPGEAPPETNTPPWLERERELSRQRMRERRRGDRPDIGAPSTPIIRHMPELYARRVG